MIIKEFREISSAVFNKDADKEAHQNVAKALFGIIGNYPQEKALACNQVGVYDYRVVITTIGQPLFYINPKIVNKSEDGFYISQSCASLPNKLAKTKRYRWIEVAADNFEEPVIFGDYDDDIKYRTVRLNQTAALQKAIDMLDCISILHNQDKNQITPMRDANDNKYSRNQMVTIVKDDKEVEVKYKRVDGFLQDGWKIKNE